MTDKPTKCWSCKGTEFWQRGRERVCARCHPPVIDKVQHRPGDSWKGRGCPYGSFTCTEGWCSGCEVYQTRGDGK